MQFLSTPSARRATCIVLLNCAVNGFLSTPSARRATLFLHGRAGKGSISIHALREEGDFCKAVCASRPSISIHALREEGDSISRPTTTSALNFYPRPPRGGRRGMWSSSTTRHNFYPRPPRGGRPGNLSGIGQIVEFLSTPSARRATCPIWAICPPLTHFYPRPPRGGRQQKQRQNLYFLINYTTFCTNLEEP